MGAALKDTNNIRFARMSIKPSEFRTWRPAKQQAWLRTRETERIAGKLDADDERILAQCKRDFDNGL